MRNPTRIEDKFPDGDKVKTDVVQLLTASVVFAAPNKKPASPMPMVVRIIKIPATQCLVILQYRGAGFGSKYFCTQSSNYNLILTGMDLCCF